MKDEAGSFLENVKNDKFDQNTANCLFSRSLLQDFSFMLLKACAQHQCIVC